MYTGFNIHCVFQEGNGARIQEKLHRTLFSTSRKAAQRFKTSLWPHQLCRQICYLQTESTYRCGHPMTSLHLVVAWGPLCTEKHFIKLLSFYIPFIFTIRVFYFFIFNYERKYIIKMSLQMCCASRPRGVLLKYGIWFGKPKIGFKFCISNKLPGDAHDAGPWTKLWVVKGILSMHLFSG